MSGVGGRALAIRRGAEVRPVQLNLGTPTSHVVGNEYRPKPMNTMKQVLSEIAASDVPVLLIGEPGVGKHIVARQIHDGAPWRSAPFVHCDCRQASEIRIREIFGTNGSRETTP